MNKCTFYRFCIFDGKETVVKAVGWEYRGFAIHKSEGRFFDWRITHIESGILVEDGHMLRCLARDSIERAFQDGRIKRIQDFLTSDKGLCCVLHFQRMCQKAESNIEAKK